VLVLMMLFRREGLLPESRTRLVLHEQEKTGVSQAAIELDELDAETAEGTQSAIVAEAAEHPVEQR
jgi:branched-chain amino acid transport system permease protein